MALSLSETTTQGVKCLNSAMWQMVMQFQLHPAPAFPLHSLSAVCPLLPPLLVLGSRTNPGCSQPLGLWEHPGSPCKSSSDPLLFGIGFQLSWQEQSRSGSAMGREGCFHSLHISLRFAFQTDHRTYIKITQCFPDSSSEKPFNGKGAECLYGRPQSSGQRMAKLCVWDEPSPIPSSLLCCLLNPRRAANCVPNCLWWCFPWGAAFLYSSAWALSRGCGHRSTKQLWDAGLVYRHLWMDFSCFGFSKFFPLQFYYWPSFTIWHPKLPNFETKQKYKVPKWAQIFPRLYCQAQSLWNHLKVNLII